MATTKTTALEFANQHVDDGVIVFYAGVGQPMGEWVAWNPPETCLPFDLAEIDGKIVDGEFHATALHECSDHRGNTITTIALHVDADEWQAQCGPLQSLQRRQTHRGRQ